MESLKEVLLTQPGICFPWHGGTNTWRKHAYLMVSIHYFYFWTCSLIGGKVQGLSLPKGVLQLGLNSYPRMMPFVDWLLLPCRFPWLCRLLKLHVQAGNQRTTPSSVNSNITPIFLFWHSECMNRKIIKQQNLLQIERPGTSTTH